LQVQFDGFAWTHTRVIAMARGVSRNCHKTAVILSLLVFMLMAFQPEESP